MAIGLLVAGCGGSSDDDTVGKEIADDYNEAMDKAREVEQQLQEQAEEIDRQVEQAVEEVEKAIEKQRNP
jgi:precorrin-2 methylase